MILLSFVILCRSFETIIPNKVTCKPKYHLITIYLVVLVNAFAETDYVATIKPQTHFHL